MHQTISTILEAPNCVQHDLYETQRFFQPQNNWATTADMSHIIKKSIKETAQCSITALNDYHSPTQATEWADTALTLLKLATLAGVKVESAQEELNKALIQIKDHFANPNAAYNHALVHP